MIIFYRLLNIHLFPFLRELESKLFDSVDDKGIWLVMKLLSGGRNNCLGHIFTVYGVHTYRMLLQKAEETENYEEKHDYLYLANCLLKGKHSFWHIVLLASHELTTDVFTNSARSKCYGLE